ncbi:hypothetical protein G7046_g1251 [Stylonectria norvegica]|nr:hypothetical protein G7046_g1251 [Stylonectria norvegica]
MRLLHTLVVSALFSLGNSAAIPKDEPAQYDAIIVGGGPAGLAALSGLARVRRNVLLIDSGEYRNAPTRHMHDVLGFDGVTPAYFRWAARKQLSYYDTVTMTNGTVTDIKPAVNNTKFFVSATYANNEKKVVSGRKIILATGLKDILPTTPGFKENWGNGIYWCPWCDGHEHADQPLGLMASLDQIPGLVREVLSLNKDIVAFVNGSDTAEMRAATETKSPKWQKYLELHNVRVENRTIAEIRRTKNGTSGHENPSLPSVAEFDSFSVEFPDGPPTERAAFLVSLKDEQTSKVGQNLGVKLYGGRLAADGAKGLITNIDGVYAIGDANSDNVTNVPHALFSGKRTAVYLHVRLESENAAKELAAVEKRDDHTHARSLWERINGQPGDLLYAGEFDQSL